MKQKVTDQKEMDQDEAEGYCAYFRRSRYDMVQARTAGGWGGIHTYIPCDVRAAKRAGQMLLRMQPAAAPLEVRHARRARLHTGPLEVPTDVVVVTRFPKRSQSVFHLETAMRLRVRQYLEDEALAALDAALKPLP